MQKITGTGLGLRGAHIPEVVASRPAVRWFEVLADNHLIRGGRLRSQLEAVREHYPMTLHGVRLSVASVDPLDYSYLSDLRWLADTLEIDWISDHCCFTTADGHSVHDLLPVPYTEEAAKHIAARIREAQDCLGRRLLLENVTAYVSYAHSSLSEAEFLNAVAEMAGCDVLLDLNNLHINEVNLGQNARHCLDALDLTRVREVHLAGYQDLGNYLLDAHDRPVADPVWALYDDLLARTGPLPTLIEWDNDLPAFSELQRQAQMAQHRLDVCEAHLMSS